MKDIMVKLGTKGSRDDGYDTDCDDVFLDNHQHIDASVFSDEADFGILFDVDGVLARGSTPLTAAIEAIRLLEDDQGRLRVPVAFVTNACNRSHDKAAQIQKWLDIQVTPDQVVHAPTPAKLLKEYHNKHTLIIGQEHRQEIAKDLGFTNVCTIEDIQNAYPLLDMVDHEKRNAVANGNHPDDPNFPPVEAVLLIGEPTHWESHLQLLVDLLVTGGLPNSKGIKHLDSVEQLPVIACCMDLVFMHQACMPRLAHGAFLVCLEALYKKITGRDLEYRALIGKPCEITYRYAEQVIADVAKRIGIHRPLRKLYFVGDNPSVDVVGANLYSRHLRRVDSARQNGNNDDVSTELPSCRRIPTNLGLPEQMVKEMESILVGTGVYKHEEVKTSEDQPYHGHRDFDHEPDLAEPQAFVPDVCHAIQYVLRKEEFNPNNVVSAHPGVPMEEDNLDFACSAQSITNGIPHVQSLPVIPVSLK